MPEYSPAEAAKVIGISTETLRKHAREFASFLSETAQGGPNARRRYQDTDILVLQRVGILLATGATYEETRQQLGGDSVHGAIPRRTDAQDAPENAPRPIIGDVTVIEPSDQQQALALLLQAQSDLITRQQQHIADQAQMIDAQRAQVEALERGVKDVQQETADTRADLVGQLEATRARLGRIPRWLRALFGATEE